MHACRKLTFDSPPLRAVSDRGEKANFPAEANPETTQSALPMWRSIVSNRARLDRSRNSLAKAAGNSGLGRQLHELPHGSDLTLVFLHARAECAAVFCADQGLW